MISCYSSKTDIASYLITNLSSGFIGIINPINPFVNRVF